MHLKPPGIKVYTQSVDVSRRLYVQSVVGQRPPDIETLTQKNKAEYLDPLFVQQSFPDQYHAPLQNENDFPVQYAKFNPSHYQYCQLPWNEENNESLALVIENTEDTAFIFDISINGIQAMDNNSPQPLANVDALRVRKFIVFPKMTKRIENWSLIFDHLQLKLGDRVEMYFSKYSPLTNSGNVPKYGYGCYHFDKTPQIIEFKKKFDQRINNNPHGIRDASFVFERHAAEKERDENLYHVCQEFMNFLNREFELNRDSREGFSKANFDFFYSQIVFDDSMLKIFRNLPLENPFHDSRIFRLQILSLKIK